MPRINSYWGRSPVPPVPARISGQLPNPPFRALQRLARAAEQAAGSSARPVSAKSPATTRRARRGHGGRS
jgi:hypothetical protein